MSGSNSEESRLRARVEESLKKRSQKLLCILAGLMPALAISQVPDIANAFDAGGSALGMGSAGTVLGSDTQSIANNPAGLGFAQKKQVGFSMRNLPKTKSSSTGDLLPAGSETVSSTTQSGPTALSHFGLIVPLGSQDSPSGALGVTLSTAGILRDDRYAGPGLTEGGVAAPLYSQRLQAKTDLLTIAYGSSLSEGLLNWGVGVVYASSKQSFSRSAPSGTLSSSGTGSGIGALVGLQVNPVSLPNWSLGISYRTPIQLKGGGSSFVLDEVPGKFSAGVGYRFDGLRRGIDYLVLASQVDHYSATGGSPYVPRSDQTVIGTGLEYGYVTDRWRLPIRIGYTSVPGAGRGFANRDAFTFGIGLRPDSGNWGIDLGFTQPRGGSSDFALSMFYRFGQ